jgi:predicted Zn-dependent peptidase
MYYPNWKPRHLMAGLTLAAAMAVTAQAAGDLPTVSYTKYVLPNGLTVILSVDKTAPVVASYLQYHVGSANERPDRTGFAHFFEHLMFEGTANIPRHSIDKIVQSAGGQLNAHTTFNHTGYEITLPSNQLKLALWLESERMLHAQVEDIGVETQRGVVKEERKASYDNRPYSSWTEKMMSAMFPGTPYAWTPIGSAQYIDQAKIEEFRDFYRTYYVPNNATLVIVGDIDIDRTKALINDYFADIPRGKEVVQPTMTNAMGIAEKVIEINEPQTPLPGLFYGYRTVGRHDPDSYALSLLTTVLADGHSSRLYREMVAEKKAAVEVAAFPFTLEHTGMVTILAISHPSTTMEQLGAMFDEEVRKVATSGVTEEEFQKARNQFETGFAARFNNAMDKAQALADYQTFDNDPGKINTEFDLYMKVTRDDIQRVAKKYLVPANRVVLKYLPPKKGGVN